MIELLFDQDIPDNISQMFEPIGGTFLLHVPSGRIIVSGYEEWLSGSTRSESVLNTPAGFHTLFVYSREHFDPARYETKIQEVVGKDNWAFRNRISRLYFLGCLPTIATIISILIPACRDFAIYVAAFAVLAWFPYLLLKRTRRYQDAENRRAAYEKDLPLYILVLKPIENPDSMIGGYLTI